jgi:hypothetical protein
VPRPLADDIRAAILTDIRAGKDSARAIAKKHGVAASTISKLAKDAGVVDAFERVQTQKATRAAEIDNRARRAIIATELLNDVAHLRERAWSPYTVAMGTAMGVEKVTLDLPPLGEVRSAYTAIGIVLDKHLALDRHDNSGGADVTDAVSMLTNLAAGIRRIAEQEASSGE